MGTPALIPRRSRLVAPIAATMSTLALIAAGCGGVSTDSGAEASAVANYIPSGALVYVELSTDFDGAQWTQLNDIAKTFPSYPSAKAQLEESMSSGDVDFEKDVKPILGERAAIGVMSVPPSSPVARSPLAATTTAVPDALENDGQFIGVIELKEGKEEDATKLIERGAEGPPAKVGDLNIYKSKDSQNSYAAVVPGAILIGSSPEQVQAAQKAKNDGGGANLAGTDRFTDAIGKLPEQTFAQGYVDLGNIMKAQAANSPQLQAQAQALDMYKDVRVASAAAAEPEGVRMKGVTVGGPEDPAGTSFSPSLTEKVPGNAIAYIGLQNLQGQVEQGIKNYVAAGGDASMLDQANAAAGQLQSLLGISLDDLRALSTKEHAIVVAPGSPNLTVSGVFQVDDPARATRTLDALRTASPGLLAQTGTPAQWRQVPLNNGVTGWELPLRPTGDVTYGVDGNNVLLGSSTSAVKDLQSPTDPLSNNADFTKAMEGAPDQVTSVIWLNVGEMVRAGEAMGAMSASDTADLRRITSISGWSTGGKEQTFEIFVRVKPQ